MSYILDALRRADAERERGAVPGLNSQPPVTPAPAIPAAPRRGPWIAAGAVLALVAVGGLWWSTQAPPRPAPEGPPGQAPRGGAAAPVARADLQAPPPAPQPDGTPVPRVGPPRIAPPPDAEAPRAGPQATARPAPAPERQASAAPRPTPAQAPVAPERAVPIEQLSAEQRRSLPQLAIGGAIYSDQPAARMLLVGGQLLHEGDTAAPGVTLERIGPRSAVLRWRELRYEVAY